MVIVFTSEFYIPWFDLRKRMRIYNLKIGYNLEKTSYFLGKKSHCYQYFSKTIDIVYIQ